jgi:hypothetical protein
VIVLGLIYFNLIVLRFEQNGSGSRRIIDGLIICAELNMKVHVCLFEDVAVWDEAKWYISSRTLKKIRNYNGERCCNGRSKKGLFQLFMFRPPALPCLRRLILSQCLLLSLVIIYLCWPLPQHSSYIVPCFDILVFLVRFCFC